MQSDMWEISFPAPLLFLSKVYFLHSPYSIDLAVPVKSLEKLRVSCWKDTIQRRSARSYARLAEKYTLDVVGIMWKPRQVDFFKLPT